MFWFIGILTIILAVALRIFTIVTFIKGDEIFWRLSLYVLQIMGMFNAWVVLINTMSSNLLDLVLKDNYYGEKLSITAALTVVLTIILMFFALNYYLKCTNVFFSVYGGGYFEKSVWHTGKWKAMMLYGITGFLCINAIGLLQKFVIFVVDGLCAPYIVLQGVLIMSFAVKWIVAFPLIVYAAYKVFDTVYCNKVLSM